MREGGRDGGREGWTDWMVGSVIDYVLITQSRNSNHWHKKQSPQTFVAEDSNEKA